MEIYARTVIDNNIFKIFQGAELINEEVERPYLKKKVPK